MTVDEAPDELGRTLFMPPRDAGRADDLKAMLPQFALPGEERFPVRDLSFVHRFNRPEDPDGTTLVLLHGTGGDETDLMPMARRIAPRSTLLGVRGRATEEGTNRWFRRSDATTFDEVDIRSEAEAFAAFVKDAVAGYGLDATRLAFLGYSNGADMLGAVMQLHPGVVRRAVLLRAIQAMQNTPAADLSKTSVLMLRGRDDPFARDATSLADAFRELGAAVEPIEIAAGHELTLSDATESAAWIHRHIRSMGPQRP
jgi:phospholipase/carboxylesterase